MNYTTIEQSKKLKELGLSLTTADAFYDKVFGIVVASKPCTDKGQEPAFLYIPCWSVGALLDLIPSYLRTFNEGIDFALSKAKNNKWYSAHYIKTEEDGTMEAVCVKTGNTPIDACYEMVAWLLENGYIEKGE